MSPTPQLSIILPVYNAGRHLSHAVQSILDQSYTDFELLAIDDGSTDESWETLKEYRDPRMHLYAQENQGLFATLNRGIQVSRGQFIARMDQDDYSEPDRLKKQVDFLVQHPEVGVLGTTAYIMNEAGETTAINPSLLHDTELKLQLLYQTPFTHGSVMINRDHLVQLTPPFYRGSAGNAEDYDFWSRLAPLTTFATLAEPLYGWRDNPTGMSNSGSTEQRKFAHQVIQGNLQSSYLNQLLVDFSPAFGDYANELLPVHGRPARCNRKDNYSYLLVRLASVLWNKGFRSRSISLLLRILVSNPLYFFRAVTT